jgi:hypothetical protein
MSAPYYGGPDYITWHGFNSWPSTLSVGGQGTASVTTCYSSSGCHNDEWFIFSNNTSVVTVTNTYGVLAPRTVNAQGAGSTSLTSSASGQIDYWGSYGTVYAAPAQVQVQAPCAVPTNFRQTSWTPVGNRVIRFFYTWDSSVGPRSNLAACQIQEYVTYPGTANPFVYGSPFPADATFPNPSAPAPGSATNSVAADTHSVGSQPFQTPYSNATFTAHQQYRWRCQCFDGNNFQVFPGFTDLPIVRTVSQVNGMWTYTVTKSGQQVTLSLP